MPWQVVSHRWPQIPSAGGSPRLTTLSFLDGLLRTLKLTPLAWNYLFLPKERLSCMSGPNSEGFWAIPAQNSQKVSRAKKQT